MRLGGLRGPGRASRKEDEPRELAERRCCASLQDLRSDQLPRQAAQSISSPKGGIS
jgi:hypothetical protein